MLDNARRILDIYLHFDSKPGDVLLANHFVAIGQRRDWRMSELQGEIEYAHRRGWVEKAPLGWRLTDKGYREASLSAAIPAAQV